MTLYYGYYSGTVGEEYNSLYVPDFITKQGVGLNGTAGLDGGFLQGVAKTYRPLALFKYGDTLSVNGEAELLSCGDSETVVVKAVTSTDVSVTVRVCFYDRSNLKIWSGEYVLAGTSIQDDNMEYETELSTFSTIGASKAQIRITALVGTADIYMAAI